MFRWGLYSLRNLWARRVTTALTVVGLGLVVFVLLAVLMLAHGLEQTLGKTGDPENVIILRKGALSEIGSSLSREEIRAVAAQPDVRLTADGRPLAVAEVGLQLTLRKGQGGSLTSVTLRGTAPEALAVRPAIRLIQGRLWKPGTTEIVVGASIARQFPDARVDRVLHFGNWAWTVVGVFEAGGSGFDSEVWGDAEQFLATFHRATFSSMTLRLAHPATLPAFKDRIERDPRFKFSVKREPEYYEGKAEGLARMIRVTGLFLTVVFSVGAVLGATMTMSASVAQRTTEIGTLRTIGFTRVAILQAFLLESMALGAIAGVLGVVAAVGLQSMTISTMNFDTGTELVFGFHLSGEMIAIALVFAMLMSIVGGIVPATRAARLVIVQALGERTF